MKVPFEWKSNILNFKADAKHAHLFINIRWCVSQTQQNFIMFIIVLGQHVSILIESSSGPSKKIDSYLEMCS
jgi:hypothetical protein